MLSTDTIFVLKDRFDRRARDGSGPEEEREGQSPASTEAPRANSAESLPDLQERTERWSAPSSHASQSSRSPSQPADLQLLLAPWQKSTRTGAQPQMGAATALRDETSVRPGDRPPRRDGLEEATLVRFRGQPIQNAGNRQGDFARVRPLRTAVANDAARSSDGGELGAMRGILVGVALGAACWTVLGTVVYRLIS